MSKDYAQKRKRKSDDVEGASTPAAVPYKKPRLALRAERKAKKALQAKNNVVKKRAKLVEAPEFVASAPKMASDPVSSGQDFVPLGDAAVTAPKVSKLAAKKSGKDRQEKSERRAKKAQAKADKGKGKGQGKKTGYTIEEIKLQEDDVNAAGEIPSKASKAEAKEAKRKAKELKQAAAEGAEPETTASKSGGITKPTTNKSSSAAPRFICFVGNLPYTTTTAQVQTHFSKLSPSSIRHSTDKTTKKSRGFAFLEFDAYDKMKTCLKIYHHSMFDPDAEDGPDGEKVATKSGRKINVELTAGGGGKSDDRKKKIKGKNQKLDEERVRRRIQEKADQDKSSKDKGAKSKAPTGENAIEVTSAPDATADVGDVHPSRLARLQG